MYLFNNDTYAEISSKTKPAQIRGEKPATNRVNLSPDVGKVCDSSAQSKNVNRGSDRSAHAKVQRCPEEVQGELDGVECCSVLVDIRTSGDGKLIAGVLPLQERQSQGSRKRFRWYRHGRQCSPWSHRVQSIPGQRHSQVGVGVVA